jgi:predicted transcriptional regulator
MLNNDEIERYKQLQKQVNEANTEKQAMKAEIKVFNEQGLQKLQKYGYSSYQDVPKLAEQIAKTEQKVREEISEMEAYCTYIADKKIEKMSIFNKD